MRVILYTGKGGVGKTSIAAATGVKLAELGYKTIVMSLDRAHSLSDAFDLDKHLIDDTNGKQIHIMDNLDIQEVNVQTEIQDHWSELYNYATTILNASGIDEIVAEEIAIFPGMEEICSLLYINEYIQEQIYDVILLDCAPTGESLRFISLPTTLEWYVDKIFNLERRLTKMVRPFIKSVNTIPLPKDSYFQNIQDLFERLKGADTILKDPQITTTRLVTNPEKIVIKETQRAFMYFCLYGFCIDAVVINRIFPNDIADNFFGKWKNTQEKYIRYAEEYFSDVPIWRVHLFADEIVGLEGLQRLADVLYADVNPADVFSSENPYKFSKAGDNYKITMKLPFITKEDINLSKYGDELIIQIGSFKRNLPLPRMLMNANPDGAKLIDEHLVINFHLD